MKETKESRSPDAVLEVCSRSIESETISSKASTSDSESHQLSKPISHWRSLAQFLHTRSKTRLITLPSLSFSKLSKIKSNSMRESTKGALNLDIDACYVKSPWKNFTLSELQLATNNFNDANLIGKGGYAEVYKGCLKDGTLVAIKRLNQGSVDERVGSFLSELGIMAHVNHPNTAQLIGYGVDGGMHLVLELFPHGSLSSLLHGSKEKLDWDIRYKIALGTAEGILYLHECCPRRIIHGDIKSANILLAEDFQPKICDFGLSKWLPEQWTHHIVSRFEGTFGYLAPEYLMHGIVDEKTDVYAFGVLLLELITGRRALDFSKQSLVMWARPLLKHNKVRELVDPALANDYNLQQMNLVVVQLLEGHSDGFEMMRKCRKPSSKKAFDKELLAADDIVSDKDFGDLLQTLQ
ncbi:Protein kinase domain [Dillenia turbinata]|uniref:non-specific serine/threonine protein kinase n=1 Tax=Dillenia turbinata TaxID=194707 RepID=A0AAN8W3L9_9MAGN